MPDLSGTQQLADHLEDRCPRGMLPPRTGLWVSRSKAPKEELAVGEEQNQEGRGELMWSSEGY